MVTFIYDSNQDLLIIIKINENKNWLSKSYLTCFELRSNYKTSEMKTVGTCHYH